MATIAIVEDDTNLANLYKKRLSLEGHTVEIFADNEAVVKIKAIKPDLVLLDLMMPNVPGLVILRSLRNDSEFEMLPVIVLTNVEGATEMEEAISLGANGYILKAETDLEALASQVKRTLEVAQKPQN